MKEANEAAATRALPVLLAAALLATAPVAEAGRGWVEDPTGRTVLQVAFRDQPSYEDLAEVQAALTRSAAILCDATEGQVRIAEIRLTTSPASEDLAALWLHDGDAASGGAYDSGGGDLRRLGAHMDVFSSARLRPDRIAHLLGHHIFGLGDQYDDQRRRGQACGVGPGFERGQLDEINHSIMQGAGGMRCVEGPLLGQDCVRDDECRGSPCRAVLASEWSTPLNHDRLRGDGNACPKPSPVSRLRIGGVLPARAEPLRNFDGSDFLSARASSVWHQQVLLPAAAPAQPSLRLHFYLSHTARLAWQLTIAADAAELFGGQKGQLQQLRSWTLQFNEDFSLGSILPQDFRVLLPAGGGRGPLEVAVDLGSRNPSGRGSAGQGYDGFQMVAAGVANVALSLDGFVGCAAEWCTQSWNASRGRWELSEQSILHHGASDWQTIAQNYPFLVAPRGSVNSEAPAVCQTPVKFVTDVMGSDQVVFVLDTSRSMGMRVDGRVGEVCGNGADDDGDGDSDEDDCADSRLDYERAAVRAFIALAENRKLQIGVVSMQTDAEIESEVQDIGGGRRAVLGAVLGALKADGDTAVGTALERAEEALAKVERVGRSRAIVLMTDGVRNVGVNPGSEDHKLDPLLYRVFTVGIGSAADGLALSALSARTGGVAYATREPTGTPAILAELAARHAGHALLLARQPFDLLPAGPGTPPEAMSRSFDFSIEAKTRELVVFLGSRNDRMDDWRPIFELRAPDGERFDDTAPQVHFERGFAIARISDPRSGRWGLRVLPGGRGLQRNEVVAYSSQDQSDLYIDADPRLASQQRSVRLSARPAYVTGIEGDVRIEGSVRRPDGTEVPVALTRDPITQAWGASFDRWSGRGLYEVRLRAVVGENATPALGEPIFPGTPRALVRVVPFERTATASFFLADGPPPPCSLEDCDGDGLSDKKEAGCPEDADGDGNWNRFDGDSDNDEIFDGEEGVADVDKDSVPDFCDPETTPDSLGVAIETEEEAIKVACHTDASAAREGLRASLSAVRRIVQAMRTRQGVPTEVRADVVARLEKVIELKKQAVVIGDVLPEFCQRFQARLEEALLIERELRVRVDPYLVK